MHYGPFGIMVLDFLRPGRGYRQDRDQRPGFGGRFRDVAVMTSEGEAGPDSETKKLCPSRVYRCLRARSSSTGPVGC
jgi:hypothetical protein